MATSTNQDLARQGGVNVNFCDGALLFVSNLQRQSIPAEMQRIWLEERGCMPAEFRAQIIQLLGLATQEVTADSQFDAIFRGEQLTPGQLVVDSSIRGFDNLVDRAVATRQESDRLATVERGFQPPPTQTGLGDVVIEPLFDPRGSIPGTDLSPPSEGAMPTSIMPVAGSIGPANLSIFGDLGRIARGLGGVLPGPVGTAVSTIGRLLPGGGTQVLPAGGGFGFAPGCPEGFRVDANGRCVREGIGGAIERFLPGGQTGVLGQGGTAVIGAFGTPGVLPAQVGVINGNPIFRCPRAMVLGADNVCYAKGSLPRQFRKWKPGTRPAVSGGDVRAIRQAASAKRRVKKLAQNVGFSCAPKGRARSCPPRKK